MKLVVWDFNGVLEMGSEKAVFEITNHALAEFGYSERFTKEACDALYGKKWHAYFKELLPDLSHEKCLELQSFCFSYSSQNPQITERYIKPHPEAQEVLKTISSRGHKQILISNAGGSFLSHFLPFVGLHQAFDQIFTPGSNHLHKVDILQTYLQECGETFHEIYAVDDLPDNLSLKQIPSLKFCLYRHNPPFPDCKADLRTHNLQDLLLNL